MKCLLSSERKAAGISCCDTQSAAGSSAAEVVRRDRDYVLNKWDLPEDPEEEDEALDAEEIMSLDQFLRYYKRHTFTVTGMAFQDLSNLDGERLKRCRVQVLSPDDRLIPFCGYNSIYRKD